MFWIKRPKLATPVVDFQASHEAREALAKSVADLAEANRLKARGEAADARVVVALSLLADQWHGNR